MDKVLGLLKSRKFWAAMVGLAVIVVKAYSPNFPFSDSQILDAVLLLVAYIGGVAIEDFGLARARFK